jgi:hypothetical protein
MLSSEDDVKMIDQCVSESISIDLFFIVIERIWLGLLMKDKDRGWRLLLILPVGVILISAICIFAWARWDLARYQEHHLSMVLKLDDGESLSGECFGSLYRQREIELIGVGIKDVERVVLQMKLIVGVIMVMFSVFLWILFVSRKCMSS